MDAEKIMSGSWNFKFMVKNTLKKLARTIKFHITPLGPEAGTMMEEPVGHPSLQRHDPIYIYIYIYESAPFGCRMHANTIYIYIYIYGQALPFARDYEDPRQGIKNLLADTLLQH